MAVTVAVVVAGYATLHFSNGTTPRSKGVAEVRQAPVSENLRPSLDCSFTAFMHASTAVYFYFDVVVSEGEAPRFYQRAVVEVDGSRTNFAGNDRPVWSYSLDDDDKPMITSADGETRIVLYGLKLGVPGVLAVEAGMRSNVFRNLGGKCRQTNLSGT